MLMELMAVIFLPLLSIPHPKSIYVVQDRETVISFEYLYTKNCEP